MTIHRFKYNEPMIGEIECDELTREEIIREIELTFPEAIDIEILD